MKRFIKTFTVILTSLIFVLALYIMVFGAIARKNNELLNFFGYSYSFVPTNSMAGNNADSFDENSIVISKKIAFDSLEINDIIIYQSKTYNNTPILIVHRIIEKDLDGNFITKGDNNSTKDRIPVNSDMYQAKVIKAFKSSNMSKYQLPILLFIILLLTGFSIYQIFNIIKTIKADKLKEEKALQEQLLKEEVLKELMEEQLDEKEE